ncbi:MAG TPA: hypothetical protein VF713_11045 [Thermoanaerobaculia bacterium]
MGVVKAEVVNAHGAAEDGAKGINQRRELCSIVRRSQEQHRARLCGDLFLSRVVDGVVGRAQDLFDQQTAEAVADEEDRELAEVFLDHEVEHLAGAVGEGHAVTGVAVAGEEAANAGPLRRAGGVAEGPDSDLREVSGQPVRPGR